MTDAPGDALELIEQALAWMISSARDAEGGSLAWSEQPSDADPAASLYMGTAGVVTTLLEAYGAFGDQRYAEIAVRGARWLAGQLDDSGSGLYLGLTGTAFALSAVARVLGDEKAGAASRRALEIVRSRFDGQRWNEFTELFNGHAGIALGALAAGDLDLAVLAGDALVSLAEPTDAGVNWTVWEGLGSRVHNMAHGTVGIAFALAAVGNAAAREDLVGIALAGTEDVLSMADDDDGDGFIVHHSDPQLEGSDRYSFGWCHGPTGDAQLFRLLQQLQPGAGWDVLINRCWRTVVRSGIPRRTRPGFWDNNGHCCGTAGVLALAMDLRRDGVIENLDFAGTLVADLLDHATIDADGARWSNVEYRNPEPDLEPQPGWAHGNAGIIRELLRYAASGDGKPPPYRVTWPDQPATA
ncbi:MAG: lanthionine synthetase LanC family protein [Candidatus Dormiibacterota bacterium]